MDGPPSRILKNGTPRARMAVGRPEAVLAAARERADEMLAEATAEAEAVRARAAAELEAARAAAHAAGLEAGLADGWGRAAASLVLAARAREEALAALEGAVVEAALAVARRVVGREVHATPGDTLALAREALEAAAGLGDLVLRVGPAESGALRAEEGRLGELLAEGALKLAEDPSLGPGEVIVEATGGRVDGRIAARLDALRSALDAEPR